MRTVVARYDAPLFIAWMFALVKANERLATLILIRDSTPCRRRCEDVAASTTDDVLALSFLFPRLSEASAEDFKKETKSAWNTKMFFRIFASEQTATAEINWSFSSHAQFKSRENRAQIDDVIELRICANGCDFWMRLPCNRWTKFSRIAKSSKFASHGGHKLLSVSVSNSRKVWILLQ